jgi:hypothetical protein
MSNLSEQQQKEILPRPLINLCFHRPRLVPLLQRLFDLDENLIDSYQANINELAMDSLRAGRSDVASWCFHYLCSAKCTVSVDVVEQAIKSGDCIPLLIAYANDHIPTNTFNAFLMSLIQQNENHTFDQYWPLLYEVSRRDPKSRQSTDPTFPILASHDVEFITTG